MPARRSSLSVALLLLAAACGGSDDAAAPVPAETKYPTVDELADDAALPDLFTGRDGRKVVTAEDFATWRSDELRGAFAHYLYGRMPAAPAGGVTITPIAHAELFDGKVVYDELEVGLGAGEPLHLALFAPKGVSKPPVVFGPNKCGNQSLVADAAVRMTTSYVHTDCGPKEASRGVQASLWPVLDITGRGFALATFHESDAAPDVPAQVDQGLATAFDPGGDPATRWGMISRWTYANRRVVDALFTLGADARIDPARIAVFGHSRRGKTALWTAANDPRIALVVAHQSGTGGAALSRSLAGESVYAVNFFFPHWFDDVFPTFAEHELRLPVDQHQLLALVAPRPLLVVDGDDDAWADPAGARDAVTAASPVWKLFGDPGVVLDDTGMPRRDATLVWTTRPGGHGVTPDDWKIFLDFAGLHFGVK